MAGHLQTQKKNSERLLENCGQTSCDKQTDRQKKQSLVDSHLSTRNDTPWSRYLRQVGQFTFCIPLIGRRKPKSNRLFLVSEPTHPPHFLTSRPQLLEISCYTLFLALSLNGEESLKKIRRSGYRSGSSPELSVAVLGWSPHTKHFRTIA